LSDVVLGRIPASLVDAVRQDPQAHITIIRDALAQAADNDLIANDIIYRFGRPDSTPEQNVSASGDNNQVMVAGRDLSINGHAPKILRKAKPAVTPILFTAADPSPSTRLRLDKECREIQQKLQLAKLREQFNLEVRLAVRPEDFSQALLDVQPYIVHFTGHGTSGGELHFHNTSEYNHAVSAYALEALFKQFTDHVNCVVLSACYSEIQARAIAKHIDYVIGMNQAIPDTAAIAFAIGFYQALGAGRTVDDAFELGCSQILMQGESIAAHLTPVLIKK
jgi:hypothetical protein